MKKLLTIACNFVALLLLTTLISCSDDEAPLSNLTGILSYGLEEYTVNFDVDESSLTIANVGADSLPFGTDITALTAKFEAIDLTTIIVNGTEQISGTTVNDFSNPVTYKVLAEDGVTEKNYVVTVNVSKIDPETVSWNQIANEQWSAFEITRATSFGGKLWVYLFTKGSGFGADQMEAYSSIDGGETWVLENAVDDQFNYADEEEGYPFPYGRSIALTTFDNKLWSIAGFLKGRQNEDGSLPFDDPTKDVWSSEDGLNWIRHFIEDGFSQREAVSALTFDDKLWVIGGNSPGSFGALGSPVNDVWSSSNGTTWTQVTADAGFDARTAPSAIVFNGKMYIIGGVDAGGILLNDVWSSSDGASWTQETAAAAFTARKSAGVFAFNDKLFLIGGEGSDGTDPVQYADMWVSEDGATWTEVDVNDPFVLPSNFTARSNHAVFVEGNEIFMIGGTGPLDADMLPTYYTSVWRGVGIE
ncbi:DUF6242 domain-containing protein [Fulvivirga sp. M361]|uniref:DUF6242 domain-containing protein n=1 Tax=Fulvivirga sp. M361 TaxID=2594266 RepID=UPI0016241874|nr:DUF6242 domain-containing protein [Fulvivirga sp. M361]